MACVTRARFASPQHGGVDAEGYTRGMPASQSHRTYVVYTLDWSGWEPRAGRALGTVTARSADAARRAARAYDWGEAGEEDVRIRGVAAAGTRLLIEALARDGERGWHGRPPSRPP